MKAKTLLIAAMLGSSMLAQAQSKCGIWYFGMGQGLHSNTMSFSNIESSSYAEKENLNSFVISLFAQSEFGDKRQYAIRPELAYLRRGGYLNGFIQNSTFVGDYSLNAHYIDFRLSFIYNFGKADAKFRPYAFITPVIGFVAGGEVQMEQTSNDGIYGGVRADLSDANIAGTHFGITPGVGVKWQFRTGQDGRHLFWLGVEASYEIGLSNTYSSKEQDRKAIDLMQQQNYTINGTRRFSGFELKATLGIPFSVFTKADTKKTQAKPTIVKQQSKPEPKPEKPCYSLDEIISMMNNGENVKGKVFCSVDDINFDFSKSDIKPSSFKYLDKLAQTLIKTNANIIVKGHTDNIGTQEANMTLSKERAQAVVNYLKQKGVKSSNLQYEFFGATKPLASNDTEAGRRLNRRVEFEIQK